MQQDTLQGRPTFEVRLWSPWSSPIRPLYSVINDIIERHIRLLSDERLLFCAECQVVEQNYSDDHPSYTPALLFLSDERIFVFIDTNGRREFQRFHMVFNLRMIMKMREISSLLEIYLVGGRKYQPFTIREICPYPRTSGKFDLADMISLIKEARFNKRNRISGYSPLSSFTELNLRFGANGIEISSIKCMACGLFNPVPATGQKAYCCYCGYVNEVSEVVERMRALY